jgi:hypothetical protein
MQDQQLRTNINPVGLNKKPNGEATYSARIAPAPAKQARTKHKTSQQQAEIYDCTKKTGRQRQHQNTLLCFVFLDQYSART